MVLKVSELYSKRLGRMFTIPKSLVPNIKRAVFLISQTQRHCVTQEKTYISMYITSQVLKPVDCRQLIYKSFKRLSRYPNQDLSFQTKFLKEYPLYKIKGFVENNNIPVADKRSFKSHITAIKEWIKEEESRTQDRKMLIQEIYKLKDYLSENPKQLAHLSKEWKYLLYAIENPYCLMDNHDFQGEDNNVFLIDVSYSDFLKSQYWQVVRLKVLERDNCQCTKCGATSVLQVHHKTYDHHGDELNHLEDLITLCKWCHTKEHK